MFGTGAGSTGSTTTEEAYLQAKNHPETTEELLMNLLKRIKDEFSPWRATGITEEMVEHTYCTDHPRNFRFQIVDGHMYVVGEVAGFFEFNRMTKIFISDVASKFHLPDVDMVITTADNCPMLIPPIFENSTNCPSPAPLLANSKYADQEHCVLYPTFSLGSGGWPMPNIPSWQTYLDLMEKESHNFKIYEHQQTSFFSAVHQQATEHCCWLMSRLTTPKLMLFFSTTQNIGKMRSTSHFLSIVTTDTCFTCQAMAIL